MIHRNGSSSSWCSSSSSSSSSNNNGSDDEFTFDDVDTKFKLTFDSHHRDPKESNSNSNSNSNSTTRMNTNASNLISKCILHLDIDCFYCQCEEMQNPILATKPLAIGQKHIIVTSNYIARRLGVKKLMGRKEAMQICPALTIVEGSDLEKYRRASREVYVEFRRAVKDLDLLCDEDDDDEDDDDDGIHTSNNIQNAVKKGCMDEMFADITCAVNKRLHALKTQNVKSQSLPSKTFIYGEDVKSSVVKICEDQSGAEAIIHSSSHSTSIIHTPRTHTTTYTSHWGSNEERRECEDRLKMGIIIASHIRERIRTKTKFSTTIGVSVSPMLAKLACDFKVSDCWNRILFICLNIKCIEFLF